MLPKFWEVNDEKSLRVASDDPNQVGTVSFDGLPVPTSGVRAEVAKLADAAALQATGFLLSKGKTRAGANPVFRTTTTLNERDTNTRCPKKKRRNGERVNAALKRKGWSLKAIRKKLSPNSSRSRVNADRIEGWMFMLSAAISTST